MAVMNSNSEADISTCKSTRCRESPPTVSLFSPAFPVVPDAFASFLFGQPVVFLQGLGDFERGIRGNAANAYVQDTFKATSRLTFNLGLRYDLPFPYTEIKNRQTLWIPGPAVHGDTQTLLPDCCIPETRVCPQD